MAHATSIKNRITFQYAMRRVVRDKQVIVTFILTRRSIVAHL